MSAHEGGANAYFVRSLLFLPYRVGPDTVGPDTSSSVTPTTSAALAIILSCLCIIVRRCGWYLQWYLDKQNKCFLRQVRTLLTVADMSGTDMSGTVFQSLSLLEHRILVKPCQ